jgi:hypothetical protein
MYIYNIVYIYIYIHVILYIYIYYIHIYIHIICTLRMCVTANVHLYSVYNRYAQNCLDVPDAKKGRVACFWGSNLICLWTGHFWGAFSNSGYEVDVFAVTDAGEDWPVDHRMKVTWAPVSAFVLNGYCNPFNPSLNQSNLHISFIRAISSCSSNDPWADFFWIIFWMN